MLKHLLFFCLFPILDWRVEISFSMVSGLVLLSVLLSPSCHFNIAPRFFWSSHLSVSTRLHVITTSSSSVFISTCPNHLRLATMIFSLIFAILTLVLIYSVLIFSILFIPVIHLNILISVLSSKSAFPSAVVSLPYTRTGLMTWLIYCNFEHNMHPLLMHQETYTVI